MLKISDWPFIIVSANPLSSVAGVWFGFTRIAVFGYVPAPSEGVNSTTISLPALRSVMSP